MNGRTVSNTNTDFSQGIFQCYFNLESFGDVKANLSGGLLSETAGFQSDHCLDMNIQLDPFQLCASHSSIIPSLAFLLS